MNRKVIILFCLCIGTLIAFAQKSYPVFSPDQLLKAEIVVGEQTEITLMHEETLVLAPSVVSMILQNGEIWGNNGDILRVTRASVDKVIPSPFYKKEEVEDIYNELSIHFRGNYRLVVRMYNDGMAYRFESRRRGQITVVSEVADFNFTVDHPVYAAYANSDAPTFEEQFFNSFEQPYVKSPITELNRERLIMLPVLVELEDDKKLCITEADLEDYPGLFLTNSNAVYSLDGLHAPVPKTTVQGGHNNLQMLVTERETYIAKTKGTRTFPWRVFQVSTSDKELAGSDLVYRLAAANRIEDINWIKPGKVAWEWWNNRNLSGVDFQTGVNNETYKAYIDFASQYEIEYVILDEGWAVNGEADLMQVVPEINLPELIEYAATRNVGIILWAGYYAFDRDMEVVVEHYSAMGVKGFKIDFMDRDDQEMIQFLYKAAEVCAEHKMLVDFHGVCKPTGLQRTYPNVLNYEGVNGLEQMKWAPPGLDQVTYDVTIPYIRMVAGPMDYTQGAMRNVTRQGYYPSYSEPMSQGTRCRQLAMYVVFESPLNMLCDSPSNYMKEEECTWFISSVPTVWNETIPLDGRVGEYVAIARRSKDDWYVGGMTNWDSRELEIDLSFLGKGDYRIELFRDGVNASRVPHDYKKETLTVPADRKVKINMAPGGGFAMKIYVP
ncbi:MAG: glycoside hydrolase family 97 protein [Tannerellaceae bacterium]|nr:glycoside hydrolase family 97 protein [Tannerellaceae bacterium]